MRTPILHCVILAAGFIFSAPAVAGVGATNSGVTTSIPNQDPTQPSADVQSQSSGFVQQNQQLANQQNPAQPGQAGIALPGGTGSQSGAVPGNSANPNTAEGGKNGAPGAAPQPPPPPPAPPPVYQSNIKPVARDTPETSGEPGRTVVATTAVPTTAVPPPPSPVPVKPPAVPDTAPAPHPAQAAMAPKHLPDPQTKAAPPPPANAGGRGSAPDGYTFLLGLLVTGALLAFALVTYLRIGRGDPNDS